MRGLNLSKELEDPYGSYLFTRVNEIDTVKIIVDKPTRIDLLDIEDGDLPYILYLNRIDSGIIVEGELEIPANFKDLRTAELSINKR
jgi:hypothetical protein